MRFTTDIAEAVEAKEAGHGVFAHTDGRIHVFLRYDAFRMFIHVVGDWDAPEYRIPLRLINRFQIQEATGRNE